MPTNTPSFFAHHTEGDIVKSFVADAATDARTGRVGACILLPRWRSSTQADAASELRGPGDFLIVDPDTRRTHLPIPGRGRGRVDHDYLQIARPLQDLERFTDECLQSQEAIGTDVLVSPSFIHGIRAGERELTATIEAGEIAALHGEEQGIPVMLGLEATAEVFSDDAHRNRMIDQVVEMNHELPVYLRMTIDPPNSRRPFGDAAALSGLRQAVAALTSNDRAVVLPQSGLVGWLMMGSGASSFGAGSSSSMERNVRPSHGGGGGGRPSLHWYFCPELLGPVLAEELAALYRAGVTPCDCPYCEASPPQGGGQFDQHAASLHYLWWCARLAAELAGQREPNRLIRDRLDAAKSRWNDVRSARVALDARSRESHVEAWIQVAGS